MAERPNPYRGPRFPAEVIAHAVRPDLRFALSFRDGEGILAERGTAVSYETVRRRVAEFGAQYAEALRQRAVRAGRTWQLDEVAGRVGGQRPGRSAPPCAATTASGRRTSPPACANA